MQLIRRTPAGGARAPHLSPAILTAILLWSSVLFVLSALLAAFAFEVFILPVSRMLTGRDAGLPEGVGAFHLTLMGILIGSMVVTAVATVHSMAVVPLSRMISAEAVSEPPSPKPVLVSGRQR